MSSKAGAATVSASDDEAMTQVFLKEKFLPNLKANGKVYTNFKCYFLRRAAVGETVDIIIDSQRLATEEIKTDGFWVCWPEITSQEHYLISDEEFRSGFDPEGWDILGTAAHLCRLRDLGFKRYHCVKQILVMPCPVETLKGLPTDAYQTSKGYISKIPANADLLVCVDIPGEYSLNFVPKHIIIQKYRPKDAPVNQGELSKLFSPLLSAEGSLYRRTVRDYARRGRLGESVATVVDGQVCTETRVPSEDYWVVRPASFSGAMYVQSQDQFQRDHPSSGQDIDAVDAGLQHLVDQGFRVYENTAALCACKVSIEEMRRLVPSGRYEGTSGTGNTVTIPPGAYVCSADPGFRQIMFLPDHILKEAWELTPPGTNYTQEQLLKILENELKQHSTLMQRKSSDFARLAETGERVTISRQGFASETITITEPMSWVVQSEDKTLVLNDATFKETYNAIAPLAPRTSEEPAVGKCMTIRKDAVALQAVTRKKQRLRVLLVTSGLIKKHLDESSSLIEGDPSCISKILDGNYIVIDDDMSPQSMRVQSENYIKERMVEAPKGPCIFLSHTSATSQLSLAIKAIVQSSLPDAAFWMMEDIPAGSGSAGAPAFNKQIQEKIRWSTTVLGICDDTCASSHPEWGSPAEWKMGLKSNKKVLVVVFEDAFDQVVQASTTVAEVAKKVQFQPIPRDNTKMLKSVLEADVIPHIV